ncbi:MAG: tributyrin esterase [Methanobacteriaceae archaeon]|nr:tributyrin esterase [Methanobacteriaceae archaeon]
MPEFYLPSTNNGGIKTSASEAIIAGEDLSTRQLNTQIKKALAKDEYRITLDKPGKLNSIAVGLDSGVEIILGGDAGDFVGALNNGAFIEIDGNTGRYVGDNMTSGEIIVRGSAEDGVGFGTYNGTIVVYGDAGNAVGQLNKGGTIVIDGNMGNLAGLYMLSGEIIVTGNAGTDTGDWMIGGTIYVAGDFETGTNAAVYELDNEDKSKLSKIFRQHNIKADVDHFHKIKPKELRPFYGGD